ncbi:hypothetical protein K3727_16680 [Rhodobacteraceae bacterium M382]|nr:hypothetical protein K3727_16680 [Rhodobacteraceae bacterium M382]
MITTLLGGIAARSLARAALRYGAIALAIVLFLLTLRRSGERIGRLVERLETTEKINEVQRRMLEAAARRPRNRDELAQRLRDGEF